MLGALKSTSRFSSNPCLRTSLPRSICLSSAKAAENIKENNAVRASSRPVGRGPHPRMGPPVTMQLDDLPKTVLPADVERMLDRLQVKNVEKVELLYHRFRPNGSAYVVFGGTRDLVNGVEVMKKGTPGIGGERVRVMPVSQGSVDKDRVGTGSESHLRSDRGGSGPNGNILETGSTVVLSGLPGHITETLVNDFLSRKHSLRLTDKNPNPIVKLSSLGNSPTRFAIFTESVAEAHRLVRKLHMTIFDGYTRDSKYTIRAHVVY